MWSPRAIDIVTTLCAVIAVVFVVLPAAQGSGAGLSSEPSVSTAQHALPAAARGLSREAIEQQGERIVRGNVFSSSRRMPAARFSPATLLSDTYQSEAMAPTSAAAGVGSAGSSTDGGPQLFGVVVSDGVRQALLALRDGEPPRLLAVGDRHAGYRVTAIENDRVVLAYAGGVRTLRLTRPASRDSSRNNP